MQDQLRATKLWLQKQFKTSGIQLDPAALDELVRAVQDVDDPLAYVDSLIEEIESGGWAGRLRRRAPPLPLPVPTGGSRRQQLAPRHACLGPCPSAAACPLPPTPQPRMSGG